VQVGAVACDAAPRDLATPSFERAPAMDALAALRAGFAKASLVRCVERAVAMARAVPGVGARRVLVFSDLAAHGFDDVAAGEGAAGSGDGVTVEWIGVHGPAGAGPAPENLALLGASLERTSSRSGDALAVAFRAARYGDDRATRTADVSVDLFVGGARTARLSLPLEDGRVVERTFHHPLPPLEPTSAKEPTHAAGEPRRPSEPEHADRGKDPQDTVAVVLEAPGGEDALAVDDRVDLPFEVPRPLPVVVVDGAPQTLPFRDEVFYLESALRGAHAGRGRIALTVTSPEQLTPAVIAGARVVVLANVARLDDAAARALVDHVRAGAGALFTMGDQVDVEWWNRALAPILPAPLRGEKGRAAADDPASAEAFALTRFRADHPVLRALAGAPAVSADAADPPVTSETRWPASEIQGLLRVRTTAMMLLEPIRAEAPADTAPADAAPASDAATGEPSPEARRGSEGRRTTVLARFSNDAPALLERAVGTGRTMLWCTTIDRDWSDLAIRPGFLPLVQLVVLHLGAALEEGGPRVLTVGEPRPIHVPDGAAEIGVDPPGADERTRAVLTASDRAVVTFQATARPGLHRVYARARSTPVEGHGAWRELVGERFTVVIDESESDLRRVTPDRLESAAPAGAITRGSAEEDGDVPLWPWLLLAAIALSAGEALLARRGLR
jgi:hypothetical protein